MESIQCAVVQVPVFEIALLQGSRQALSEGALKDVPAGSAVAECFFVGLHVYSIVGVASRDSIMHYSRFADSLSGGPNGVDSGVAQFGVRCEASLCCDVAETLCSDRVWGVDL